MKLQWLWSAIKEVYTEFFADQPFRLAAALAYYTLLSLAPLFLVIIGFAGVVFGQGAARHQIMAQVRNMVGDRGAEAVSTMLSHALGSGGWLSIIIGVVAALAGATTVFVELQNDMNDIWDVKPPDTRGAVWQLLRQRSLSLAMIVGIGFLLLVSLAVSALLAALQGYLAQLFPYANLFWLIVNFLISLAGIAVLIAMIFRFLPDTQVEWRDVWTGAILTSILFTAGKFLIGVYLGRAGVGSAYGAAGSIIVLMVWVYYASLILFLGAEITCVSGRRRARRATPRGRATGQPPPDAVT